MTITYTDTEIGIGAGTQGAKRQSWRPGNPREVLERLHRKDLGVPADELENQHWEAICHSETMLRTIHAYWFANNYRALVKDEERKAHRQAATSSVDATSTSPVPAKAIAAKASAILDNRAERTFDKTVQKEIEIRLLSWTQPNGKPLRDCTKEELEHFGFFQVRVADHLQPGQTVGEAKLTEKRLRGLYSQ